MRRTGIYGYMAEFDDGTSLVNAAQSAYDQGYRHMDAYSPYPIEELSHAIGFHHTKLPLLVFIGGLIGAIGGYALQYYTSVIDYPINVGGRPYHSWPSFIPVTFETTVLCAALTAVFGMLALNGLPQPYHPVFNVPRFVMASRDRFYLVLEARDPKFDADATKKFLESLDPRTISEVEH